MRAISWLREMLVLRGGPRHLRDMPRREGQTDIARTIADRTAATATAETGDSNEARYARWIAAFDTPTDADLQAQRAAAVALAAGSRISLLMPTYNTAPWLLERAVASVRAQTYPHWELCIADDASPNEDTRRALRALDGSDPRIRIVFRAANGHIAAATNDALALATGDWIGLLDHDDELSPQALFRIAEAIEARPDAGLFYSDEDRLDEAARRTTPYFKPDWNPDLFLAQNYLCHLSVYRAVLVRELGGMRIGFEGSQDYDLALRAVERLRPAQIVHVRRVLYHWRMIPGSTAHSADAKSYAFDAARRAVQEHLDRRGIAARVEPDPAYAVFNRVRYALPEPRPLVTVIVPTRNRLDLLKPCIDSVLMRTTYAPLEVIVVDNGSDDPATLAWLDALRQDGRVRVRRDERLFNFSALNNAAARIARGSLLCFLNNDTEVMTPGWLDEMVSHASRPGIGCVGARLWYATDSIQHAGVILTPEVARHLFHGQTRGDFGYFGRLHLAWNCAAVTAACMVMRHDVFDAVGGFDESLAVAYNDVDLCLRVGRFGYRHVITPYAELRHYESASRGYEDNLDKRRRFEAERDRMIERWGDVLRDDPAYHPMLDPSRNGCDVREHA